MAISLRVTLEEEKKIRGYAKMRNESVSGVIRKTMMKAIDDAYLYEGVKKPRPGFRSSKSEFEIGDGSTPLGEVIASFNENNGNAIEIYSGDRVVARLVPSERFDVSRRIGVAAGKFPMSSLEDFNAGNAELAQEIENTSLFPEVAQ